MDGHVADDIHMTAPKIGGEVFHAIESNDRTFIKVKGGNKDITIIQDGDDETIDVEELGRMKILQA